jgi:hypothetical protein
MSAPTKRSVVIRARMSAQEARDLRAMAKRAGMTESAFIRRMTEIHKKIEIEMIAAAERAAVAALNKEAA